MFVYGLGEAATRFLSLLLLPLFTSYLSPSDYGVLSILGVLAMVVTPVFSLGLGASLGVCYFEPNADTGRHRDAAVWTAFAILLVSCSLLAVVGIGLSGPLSALAFGTPAHAVAVSLIIGSTCLSILRTPFMLRLQFEQRAKTYTVITGVASLTTIGLSLVFVVALNGGVVGMVAGWLLANALTFVVVLAVGTPGRIRLDRGVGRELLRLGIPLVPSFASLFVLQQANKSILQNMRGLDAVGVYTIGLNLGMVAGLAVSGFSYAWHPFFLSYVDRRAEAVTLFGRVLTIYVLAFGTLGMAFFIAARAVVIVMTRPPFHAAYQVVGLAATSQILIGIFSILLAGMYFEKEVKYQSIIQAVAAAIAVALNVIGIESMGIVGAALALALGYLAMAVLQHLWNRHRGYLAVRYEWARIFRFVLAYAAVAVVATWPRAFSPAFEVLAASAGVALLPLLLWGFLRPDERRFVRSRLAAFRWRRPGPAAPEAGGAG
jgi:O-antigen/teichoic acid export membrane protein